MFTNRQDAGEQLAAVLADRGVDADIVLAIPRGGLPVARVVADRLDAPLDLLAAKKLGLPGNPELAIGAATADGSAWLDEGAIERYDVSEDYVTAERERAAETAREKLRRYRGDRPDPDLAGRTVVIVDDGVATGSTARACLQQVRSAGAGHVVLAVPVGPTSSIADLRSAADEVVAVDTPASFGAVGAFYHDFTQVSDEEAMTYLDWTGGD